MKKIATLMLVAVIFLTATCLQAQTNIDTKTSINPTNNFVVHITAFNEKRPLTYFSNLDNVHIKMDNKGLWHYFIGAYASLEEADGIKKKLIEKGYPYAYVVDLMKMRKECAAQCESEPTLDLPAVAKSIRSLTNIMFNFGKSSISSQATPYMESLATIMKEYSGYKVELKGHCDAIGSPEFNQALSEKRSNAARQYLVNKDIDFNRIKTSSYGFEAPIAKNVKDGKDCPEGRKFNRRVEIFIMDAEGNVLNGLVSPFDIPNELVYDGSVIKSGVVPAISTKTALQK
jgi:outer membrane protein OmpA-like peptidoglycan-associated protein